MKLESIQNYQQLFNNLPERYLIFAANDPDFTITDLNLAHTDLTQLKLEDIKGKRFFDVWPDVTEAFQKTGVSNLTESFRTVIRTRQPHALKTLRYDIPLPDGTFVERYWRATHYPIIVDGKVAYILQATENITEEVLAANRLKDLQRQLDQALSVGLVGTWYWDITNDKLTADKNMAQMFGVDEHLAETGIPLQTFVNAIHPEDREWVNASIEEALTTHGNYVEEYRTVSADGTERWVIARGSAMRYQRSVQTPAAKRSDSVYR